MNHKQSLFIASAQNRGFAPILILLLGVLVGGVAVGGYFYHQQKVPSSPAQVACTLEAKICPDGSSVGRTVPNCEFAECLPEDTKTWGTYIDPVYKYSLKFPSEYKVRPESETWVAFFKEDEKNPSVGGGEAVGNEIANLYLNDGALPFEDLSQSADAIRFTTNNWVGYKNKEGTKALLLVNSDTVKSVAIHVNKGISLDVQKLISTFRISK